MKKKLLFGLMAVLLAGVGFGGISLADSVAEINGTQYATLAEAIEVAENEDEIVLLSDMTLDDNTQFIINKNITINGNNHEITASISRVDFGGVFTFVGGSEGSTIKDMIVNFVGTERDNSVIYFFEGFGVNEGTTTVENITVNGSNDQGIAVLTPSLVNGTISIIGNTFKDLKYGMYFNSLNNVTIKNNTINGTKYNAINLANLDDSDVVVISENEMTNISNVAGNAFGDMYSAGIYVSNNKANVTIEDNTIKTLNGHLPVCYGYVAEIKGTQYATLAKAIEAAQEGDEIVLLSDITLDDDIHLTISKKITLNGGNHKIIAHTTQDYQGGVINLAAGSEGSTIKDLTIDFASEGDDTSAIYFVDGFDGTSANKTSISSVTINGREETNQESGIIGGYNVKGEIEISENNLSNLKFGIFLNSAVKVTISENTIDSTRYNAINLACDNENYTCSEVVISDNELTNISKENYDGDVYSAGINVGPYSNVSIEDNKISMLNGKKEINYNAEASIGNQNYATLAEAIAAAKEGDIVKLLNNVELAENTQYDIVEKVTINGSGNTLTAKSSRDYMGGIFNFKEGSEGSTIENLVVDFEGTAEDTSVIYFIAPFGSDSATTTVNNIVINGNDDNGIGVLTPGGVDGLIEIKNSTFNDLKYGMYFNGISDVTIENSTFDSIKYNAIHVVEGENITISNNTLNDISTANYDDENGGYENGFYSAGISFEKGVTGTNDVSNNDIKMLNDKLEIYYEDETQAQKYTVEFKDGDAVISTAEYTNGETIVVPANPTKNGYTFAGWNETPATVMSNSNLTYIAQWTKKSSGGGSSSSFSNKTPTTTGTVETGTVDTGAENSTTGENTRYEEGNQQEVLKNGFTREFNNAYNFAYLNGITTMKSISKADMNGNLSRIAMAKMLSQYAINVLGKTPDTTKKCEFKDVTSKMDKDYNDGVTLACQLGIMGMNMGDNFRPNDTVVRAEFGTALSRMVYGISDGKDQYYSTHLAKLKAEKVITNDNPSLQELRGYVMLMLMRSAE